MVVLSLEQYSALTDEPELKLDEADKSAALSEERRSGEEVFKRVRGRIHVRKAHPILLLQSYVNLFLYFQMLENGTNICE